MTTFQVVLAVAILVAFFSQLLILFLLYRVLSRAARKVERLCDLLEPEIGGLATGIRAIRRSLEVVTTEAAAIMAGLRATSEDLTQMARSSGHQLRRQVDAFSGMVETQIREADQALGRGRARVAGIASDFDRILLQPVRVSLALAAGVGAALDHFLLRRRRSSDEGAVGDGEGPRE